MQDEDGVFDVTGHGAELVERPTERHSASARDAAVGGPQSGDAATHGRADDAPAGLAADGETNQARGGGGARSGTGAGGGLLDQPRVHGLSAKPDVVERERAEAQLGDEHSAGGVKALYHSGVFAGDAIAERLGAVGGGDAGGIEQVFSSPGNAMQGAAIFSGGDFL